MSQNLAQERASLPFSLDELSHFIYGSKEELELFLKYQSVMDKEPLHKHDPDFYSLSRKDKIKKYIKRFHHYHKQFDFNKLESLLMAFAFFSEPLITSLHQAMFIPCLKNLTTQKQYEKWVPLAESYKMIGCYAQTEMGHGSDVQSLETTSTYHHPSDSFIINSPTLTSTKMWPGDLGIFSTHAMVFAQLIIDDKNFGVQAFLVPIRDMETHDVLEGVEAGDIGPKSGYGTKDNGYLRLNNVRIPRECMLMKYAKVSKDGEFKKVGNEKVLYGIMLGIRLLISGYSMRFLGHGLTVAIRYSIVRTQFKQEGREERRILDYQLQQEKLFPLLAQFYAMCSASTKLRKMIAENNAKIQDNDFSLLNETHITLAGTKAYFSYLIFFGLERCRLACGGHGFSHYSALPSLQVDLQANCTLEGENTVMYLQVARYLLKLFEKMSRGGKLPPLFDYMSNGQELIEKKCSVANWNEWLEHENLRKLLLVNAYQILSGVAGKVMEHMGEGMSMKKIWDRKIGIGLVQAARAHTLLFTFKCFHDGIRKIHDLNIREALISLCSLFALHEILEQPNGIIESSYLTPEQFKYLTQAKQSLLPKIRPFAVGLVDALSYSDNTLRSALGRGDGKVYETMFEWASEKNSMNEKEIGEGMEYIFQMKEVQPKL